jgi:hypothetical protein
MPIFFAVFMTRQAISPRLAISIFLNIVAYSSGRIFLLWSSGAALKPTNGQWPAMKHVTFSHVVEGMAGPNSHRPHRIAEPGKT